MATTHQVDFMAQQWVTNNSLRHDCVGWATCLLHRWENRGAEVRPLADDHAALVQVQFIAEPLF